MCTSGLVVLTHEEVLGERSTRKDDLLISVLGDPREILLGDFDL